MIAIVDYGMGNLRSVSKAFEHLGHPVAITRNPRVLSEATHVVLPGVGAFPDGMNNLKRFELLEPLREVITKGKPFLGICLGLQLLFTESEEFGLHRGMDIIAGRVVRFNPSGPGNLKVPHMGWNRIRIKRHPVLFRDIPDGCYFYFVHSYYVSPDEDGWTCTTTQYGFEFVSGIWKDNIFACQFHPEKSQAAGLRLLENFARWKP